MSQEEKDLLVKDLCARLPYGVKVKYLYWDENKECEYPIAMVLDSINSDGYIKFHGDIAEGGDSGMLTQNLPYLRSISNMTDGEENEYRAINCYEGLFPRNEDALDYALEHHLDIRNLIEKGLALEAPEGMYKNE